MRTGTAINSPTFTADGEYAYNGSTNYVNTGFVPSTHAVSMTGTNLRLSVYERTNAAAGTTYAAGTRDTSTVNLEMRPRSAASTAALNTNSGALTYTLPADDSRGYTVESRNGAGAPPCAGDKNGVAMTQAGSVSFGTTLPTRALYVGAENSAGTAGGFRAATIGFVAIGAQLTAQQEADEYAAIQAYMTAIGAQV